MCKLTTQVLALLVLAVTLHGAPAQAPADSLWSDLASADEVTVMRAILMLSKTPAQTLAFLKQNLLPVKADSDRVKKLVADLDSNQFAVRQKAADDLEYLGKYIKSDLEKALTGAGSIETRQRLQQLLDKMPKPVKEPAPLPAQRPGGGISVSVINGKVFVNGVPVDGAPTGPAGPIGPPMSWVRAVRAIALLEHMGTTEARQILETLANGEADALPTEQARMALARLDRR